MSFTARVPQMCLRAYWKIIDGAEESHTVDQSLIAGSSNPATREKV